MAKLRTDFEVANKQKEVDLLEKEAQIQMLKDRRQKSIIYISIAFSVLVLALAFGLLNRYNFIRRTKRIIENEKNRSDTLLKNIKPEKNFNQDTLGAQFRNRYARCRVL